MIVKDLLMTYEGNIDYIMMFAPAENETMDENSIYIRLKK